MSIIRYRAAHVFICAPFGAQTVYHLSCTQSTGSLLFAQEFVNRIMEILFRFLWRFAAESDQIICSDDLPVIQEAAVFYNGAEKSKEMPEKMSAFQFQGEGDYATKKKNNRSKKGHSSNSISDTSTKKNMVKADPVRKAKQLEGQMNFLDSYYLDDM